MKLLVRVREKIVIVYITIVFVSVLVSFVIAAILAHVTWAPFHSNSQNSYMGAYPGVGTCPEHYSIIIIVVTYSCFLSHQVRDTNLTGGVVRELTMFLAD